MEENIEDKRQAIGIWPRIQEQHAMEATTGGEE